MIKNAVLMKAEQIHDTELRAHRICVVVKHGPLHVELALEGTWGK